MNRKFRRSSKRSDKSLPASPPAANNDTVSKALATANTLIANGRYTDAIDLCQRILGINKHHAEAQFTLASSFEMNGQPHEARLSYHELLQTNPHLLPALVNYAAVCADLNLYSESIQHYKKALSLDRSIAVVHQNLAAVYKTLRQLEPALQSCMASLKLQPTVPGYCELAEIYELSGRIEEAISTFEKVVTLTNVKAPYYIMLARLELIRNNKQAALGYLDKCLGADPHYGYAHLMKAKHFSSADRFEEMKQSIVEAIAAAHERAVADYSAPLYFALGHLEDKAADYKAAFDAYRAANDKLLHFHSGKITGAGINHAFEISQAYGNDFSSESHSQDPRPTFILGLPRSGTTLIEQMLAQHPNVIVMGELELMPTIYDIHVASGSTDMVPASQFYLDAYPAMGSDATRVVDKSISSYQYANFIVSMFPNARFIFSLRHPMAVLWSAYREYFQSGASTFAYDIAQIVEHIKTYYDVLESFRGGQMDVYYERLINDPEITCRAMTEYLEIPWDDAMLRFSENKRPVRTASLGQVRQPLYKSSAEQWRNYLPYLESAYEELTPLIAAYEEKIG